MGGPYFTPGTTSERAGTKDEHIVIAIQEEPANDEIKASHRNG